MKPGLGRRNELSSAGGTSVLGLPIIVAQEFQLCNEERSFELLALPVVELLDAADHTDAAPEDLLGAWVPADVVRIARAPRDQRQAGVAGAERVCDACARRTSDDGTPADRMLFRLGRRWHRRCQHERSLALEHDQDLLLGGMHVRRAGEHARIQLDVLQAGPARARGAGEIAPSSPATDIGLDVLRVHDRRRALLGRLRPIEPRLAVPRVAGLNLDEAGDRPHRAAARQLARIKVLARAERDHVEAVVTGADRVRLVRALVDDAVALADLVRVVVEQRQSRAAEDIEDLLGITVDMRRRRLFARLELDAGHARSPAAGGGAQRRPRAGHLAAFSPEFLDVVPVRNPHAATLCDGLCESCIATFYGGACTFVSFQFGPGLRRLDEPAQ